MSIFDKFKMIEKEKVPSGPVEYIIAGLANPGEQYAFTRHNAGFMAADALAEHTGASIKKLKFKSLTADVEIGGTRCLLMKPATFMNNSGQAVREALDYYKLDPERLIVIYDDISLEPGKVRIRRKGSDGGHNGIKSIIYLTGSDSFPRIKIGVGKKPHPKFDLADWVLSRFSEGDMEKINQVCRDICTITELMVSGRTDEAMNRFNS